MTSTASDRLFERVLAGEAGALLPRERTGELRTLDASDWDDAGTGREAPALGLFTSGSTGAPKGVALPLSALLASARATESLLHGPGRWVQALPENHIAGAQVVLRALLAGAPPARTAPGPFAAAAFAAAVERTVAEAGSSPVYASLVPTQLHRVLADADAARAASRCAAILLGGSAISPRLLERADAAGIPIVRTYGMSETAGGCVYDGAPFDGVDVRIADDGRIVLAGPVLAHGYASVDVTGERVRLRAVPHPSTPDDGAPGFSGEGASLQLATSDLGRVDDGVLSVLGRADDVIITGGENVSPFAVESHLLGIAEGLGFAEVLISSAPDEQWGEALVAVLVDQPAAVDAQRAASAPAGSSAAPDAGAHAESDAGADGGPCAARPAPSEVLDAVREGLRSAGLGAAEIPKHALVVDVLPVRSIGKPDRRTMRDVCREALGSLRES